MYMIYVSVSLDDPDYSTETCSCKTWSELFCTEKENRPLNKIQILLFLCLTERVCSKADLKENQGLVREAEQEKIGIHPKLFILPTNSNKFGGIPKFYHTFIKIPTNVECKLWMWSGLFPMCLLMKMHC